eukprot:2478033-Alexandrium_andersonii.AAC.1
MSSCAPVRRCAQRHGARARAPRAMLSTRMRKYRCTVRDAMATSGDGRRGGRGRRPRRRLSSAADQ